MLLRPGWRRPLANFPHFNLGQPFDSAMMYLARFCGSSQFGGLVVSEVNPDHDADGSMLTELVDSISQVAFRGVAGDRR
jgi:arginase